MSAEILRGMSHVDYTPPVQERDDSRGSDGLLNQSLPCPSKAATATPPPVPGPPHQRTERTNCSSSEVDRLAMPPPPPMPHRVAIPTTTRAVLICSIEYLKACNALPIHRGRDILLWNLISAYGIQRFLRVLAPRPATYEDLTSYHDEAFIDVLKNGSASDPSELEEFGLVDDCAVFDGLWEYCRYVVGGVLTAVRELLSRRTDTAICWAGGRHHAKKSSASGYCYVNDIVIGILALQRGGMKRVLYIDMDVHHGDGVEEAFYYSPSVFTVSFHKYDEIFFPGTGSMNRIGKGKGKHRNLNVPLPDGINDESYASIFKTVIDRVITLYNPECIVLQCGADTLSRDPLGTFNLTSAGYSRVLAFLKARRIPMLILGGGGYHRADVVRCWTILTAMAAQHGAPKCLTETIPDHGSLLEYAPDFKLGTRPSCSRELDFKKVAKTDYCSKVCAEALKTLLGATETDKEAATPQTS